MAKEFVEAEIDFEGVTRDLSRLAPPKVTMEQILGRLRETLLEQKAKGVTVKQMCDVLQGHAINVSERRLRNFIETGELGRGGRPAGVAPDRAKLPEAGDFGSGESASEGSKGGEPEAGAESSPGT